MNAVKVPNFRPAEESIEWAETALSEFESAFGKFFRPENTTLIEEFDPIKDMTWVKIKVQGEIQTSSIKRHVVDCLLHSRHSFDQVINLASDTITGRRGKRNFPWSDSRTDLIRHRLKAIPKELWGAIEVQEPYPTGNGDTSAQNLIRALANYSNNKHSVGFIVKPWGWMLDAETLFIPKGVRRVIAMGPNWCPVKKEVVLYAYSGAKVYFNEQAQPGLSICFDMPKFPHPPDVGFALNLFLGAAKCNLDLVKAACLKWQQAQS